MLSSFLAKLTNEVPSRVVLAFVHHHKNAVLLGTSLVSFAQKSPHGKLYAHRQLGGVTKVIFHLLYKSKVEIDELFITQ
jgi:hypothetical protein